jgi:hypothetical protein
MEYSTVFCSVAVTLKALMSRKNLSFYSVETPGCVERSSRSLFVEFCKIHQVSPALRPFGLLPRPAGSWYQLNSVVDRSTWKKFRASAKCAHALYDCVGK